jgi:hypothetical protein
MFVRAGVAGFSSERGNLVLPTADLPWVAAVFHVNVKDLGLMGLRG